MNVLAIGLVGLGLVSAACSAAPVSVGCSDQAFLKLAANCTAAAKACRLQGGSEAECGTVCDAEADDWQSRCGK